MKKLFTINDYSESQVAELNAAYSNSFEQGYVKIGSVVTGTLLSKSTKEAVFTTYGKSNVIVKNNELDSNILSNLSIGDKTEIEITQISDIKSEYLLFGSIQKVKITQVNDFFNDAYTNKKILTGVITEMNVGGYMLDVIVNDIQVNVFMPHLLADVNRIHIPESMVGKEIEFLVEKNTKDGNTSFLASRKKYLQELIPAALSKLVVGEKYRGVITGTTDFAIFIQFNNCLTGMIHKSNLVLEPLKYNAGEIIEFFVKDIVKERLFLTQIMRDSLWDKLEAGDILNGTISSIKEYGLMMQLDHDTKGLIHKSNLNGKPLDQFNVGESFVVKVTQVNKENRQITLGVA